MTLAFWWISGKISWVETIAILKQASFPWILLALLLFNASKVLSAYRLQRFFRSINVRLTHSRNLRLYYLGMFYNLFLPGGIGGDGYKIWLLKNEGQGKLKELTAAIVIDRISGVIPLSFLALLMLWTSGLHEFIPHWLMLVLTFAFFPAYFLTHYLIAKISQKIQSVFHRSNADGLGVQALQILCAWCILQGIASSHVIELLILFLISSIVAVLPLTIGGVGAREWVMVSGCSMIMISAESGIAMSLLFFAITAICSLPGAFISTKKYNASE